MTVPAVCLNATTAFPLKATCLRFHRMQLPMKALGNSWKRPGVLILYIAMARDIESMTHLCLVACSCQGRSCDKRRRSLPYLYLLLHHILDRRHRRRCTRSEEKQTSQGGPHDSVSGCVSRDTSPELTVSSDTPSCSMLEVRSGCRRMLLRLCEAASVDYGIASHSLVRK